MASVIGICNSALVRIGAQTITSLTEGGKNANLCGQQYEKLRDELLRSHNWNFAVARVKLAQLSSPPAFGFANAYQLPADCLRVVSVHDNAAAAGAIRYQLEGDALLSDSDAIYLRYVRRQTDVNAFDALFREALGFRLASELAIPIAQSNALKEQLQSQYERAITKARGVDAQENYPEAMPDGTWITARH